jgi:hypothetical protein
MNVVFAKPSITSITVGMSLDYQKAYSRLAITSRRCILAKKVPGQKMQAHLAPLVVHLIPW